MIRKTLRRSLCSSKMCKILCLLHVATFVLGMQVGDFCSGSWLLFLKPDYYGLCLYKFSGLLELSSPFLHHHQAALILLPAFLGSYVSEVERRHAIPSEAQRHILAGLASVVGGLSAPYEKASHVHERPVVNWLWAAGCHPFGPFSNTSKISQMLHDVALVWSDSLSLYQFFPFPFCCCYLCILIQYDSSLVSHVMEFSKICENKCWFALHFSSLVFLLFLFIYVFISFYWETQWRLWERQRNFLSWSR